MPFWEAVLGYVQIGDILVDPHFEGPVFWFQQMDAPRPQRNRIHIDLYLPEDQARARLEAGLAAGGRVVNDANVPEWWTLADPESNEVDVALAGCQPGLTDNRSFIEVRCQARGYRQSEGNGGLMLATSGPRDRDP